MAELLGYKNPHDAIRKYCKGVSESRAPSSGGIQAVKIIPRPDLLRLVAKSKLPAAEAFEELVYGEVIPSVRITGMFATNTIFIPNVN